MNSKRFDFFARELVFCFTFELVALQKDTFLVKRIFNAVVGGCRI